MEFGNRQPGADFGASRDFLIAKYAVHYLRDYLAYGPGHLWALDGDRLVDLWGSLDGTYQGDPETRASSLADDDGRSVKLDSAGDYGEVSDHADLNAGASDSLTSLALLEVSSGSAARRLISKHTGSAGWRLDLTSTDSARMLLQDADSAASAATASALADGTPHLAGGIIDRNADLIRAIADGVQEGSASISTEGDASNALAMALGADPDATDFLGGALGLAAIVKDVLPPSVQAHLRKVALDRTKRAALTLGLSDYLQEWSGNFELVNDVRKFVRFDSGDSIEQMSSFAAGAHLPQPTAANRPTYDTSGARPVVKFDGTQWCTRDIAVPDVLVFGWVGNISTASPNAAALALRDLDAVPSVYFGIATDDKYLAGLYDGSNSVDTRSTIGGDTRVAAVVRTVFHPASGDPTLDLWITDGTTTEHVSATMTGGSFGTPTIGLTNGAIESDGTAAVTADQEAAIVFKTAAADAPTDAEMASLRDSLAADHGVS